MTRTFVAPGSSPGSRTVLSGMPVTMSPDEIRTTEPRQLATWLSAHRGGLEVAQALAVRDAAAGCLGSDPGTSMKLARSLSGAVSRGTPSHEVEAIAARCRAEAAWFLGRLIEADDHYRRAADEAARAGEPGLLGQILTGWVGVLGALDRHAESRRVARRAERKLAEANDAAYLGKLFGNLGNLAYHRDRFEEAQRLYGQAARAFDDAGIRDAALVSLRINQGVALTTLSRLEEARTSFREAEAASEELGLDRLRGQALLDRAHLERLVGDYRECLACLETALDLLEPLEAHDVVAAAARERATTYLELGMPAEAHESASMAATNFERGGMAQDAALSRIQEARALLLLGRGDDALTVLASAETTFRAHRLAARGAVARLWVAEGLRQVGRGEEAARVLGGAVRSLRSLGLHTPLARALLLRARLHADAGRDGHAARSATEALRAGRRLPPTTRAELLVGAAGVVRDRRPDLARRRLERAVELLESSRSLIPGAEYRARAFAARIDAYLELVDVRLDAGSLSFDDAHALAQAARARAFRDRCSGGPRGLDADVLSRRARLGARVRALEEAEAAGDDGGRRALQREVTALERDLHRRVRRSEAAGDEHDASEAFVDPDRVAARLPASTTLVSYLVVGERILALTQTRRHREMRVLEARLPEIERALDRLHFQIDTLAVAGSAIAGTFLERATGDALTALWRMLLAPLGPPAGDRERLIVVPHRQLHRVPFECLHDGDGYVDDRFILARAPVADGPARIRPRRGPAVVAGVSAGGLAAVTGEIDAVAVALFTGDREVHRLEDPGTDELLAAIRSARVVHLAAHGVFREDNPMFSRIATGDGALFVADVWGGRVDADLVVLSACNSGRVFPGRGDDLSGVTHAFLAAGARQLVATHWRVHDEATRDVMTAFHEAVAAEPDGDAAAALRTARREVRERWPHPFYWGGFGAYVG